MVVTQREVLEEDRQPIRRVKTPETGRVRRRGRGSDKETGEKNYREPGDCSESQNAFVNFPGKRFDHQDHHAEHQHRNLEYGRGRSSLHRCDALQT